MKSGKKSPQRRRAAPENKSAAARVSKTATAKSNDTLDKRLSRTKQKSQKVSEERLATILATIDNAVWSIAADTFETLYLNPAAERIYGRAASAFYSDPKLFLNIVHPEDRPRVARMLPELIERGAMTIQYRVIRPNGEVRWLEDKAVIARDSEGRPLRFDGIASDITERKAHEAQFQAKQEQLDKFAHALDLVPAMVCKLDGEILHWGRGLQAMYGWSGEEAVGRIAHELLVTEFPVPLPNIQAELLDSGVWHGELVCTRRDGGHIVVVSQWSLYRPEDDELASVLMFELGCNGDETNTIDASRTGSAASLCSRDCPRRNRYDRRKRDHPILQQRGREACLVTRRARSSGATSNCSCPRRIMIAMMAI